MEFLAIVAVLVAVASYPSLGAEISQVECQSYQETLQKAIGMKKRCGMPSFIDCCQPNTLLPTAHTGLYEISTICPNKPQSPFLQVEILSEKINVRCDMDTDGGGWIVIQRRVNGGTINFTRNWEAYYLGFGDLEGEFWFGLRNIHCLTTREEVELRIDMQNSSGTNATWTYQEFRVDGSEDNYRLHIGQGEGTTGTYDPMSTHNNNQAFTTYDRDNDARGTNCAAGWKGGWWYRSCGHANLNSPHGSLLRWYNTGSSYFNPSNVEMKVRPKTCTPAAEQCT